MRPKLLSRSHWIPGPTYSPSHYKSLRPNAPTYSPSYTEAPGQAPQPIPRVTLSPPGQILQPILFLILCTPSDGQTALSHSGPMGQAPQPTLSHTGFPRLGASTYSQTHTESPDQAPHPTLPLTVSPPGQAPQPTLPLTLSHRVRRPNLIWFGVFLRSIPRI